MSPLAALVLATPFWGFALQPPAPLAAPPPSSIVSIEVMRPEEDVLSMGGASAEHVAETRTQMDWMRGLEVATNVAMAANFVLATIAANDRWYSGETQGQTRCGQGDPMLGYCGEDILVPTLVTASLVGAISITNFSIWMISDNDLANEIDPGWPVFTVLRITARVMNAIGAIWGLLLWQAVSLGWANEQRDFETLRGLSIAHTAWGAASFAVQTATTIASF